MEEIKSNIEREEIRPADTKELLHAKRLAVFGKFIVICYKYQYCYK